MGYKKKTSLFTYRGNHLTLKITTKNDAGAVQDITGASITFSVKDQVSDASTVIQKTTTEALEVLITDADTGKFEVYVLPTDSVSLSAGKDYEFDCTLTTSDSKVYTILRGTIVFLHEIT